MEILKRAKSGGEIVAWNENPKTVREEVDRRAKKAGYIETSREKISSGWTRKFEKNYVRIFGHE